MARVDELPCVVVLGASNVARSFRTLVAAAKRNSAQPLDILTAMGHGRGYGMDCRVFGRWLPAICECGLWPALQGSNQRIRQAVLTDVGNDLMYGADVDRIAAWVELCLERLAPRTDELVMTELPLASIRRLGPFRYQVVKKILFPRSGLTWAGAHDASRRLNDHLLMLAERFRARVFRPEAEWFGWDPIHVRRVFFRRMWRQLWSGDSATENHGESEISAWRWAFFHFRPQHRRWFGVTQRRAQPALQLPCGTRISWY